MHIKRAVYISALCLALITCTVAGCDAQPSTISTTETLQIVKDMSTFHDFNVSEDKVYIRCELTIRNTSGSALSFFIKGDFVEDQQEGLLKDKALYACHHDSAEKLFTIKANETQELVMVDFIGDFGGAKQKHDRLLPEKIEFEIQK